MKHGLALGSGEFIPAEELNGVVRAPEALRLAEEITELMCSTEAAARTIAAAADELVRLHVENERLVALVEAQQPTNAQAGAVPLTKEQRNRIVLTADTVSEAIDMVERHHGIGIKGEKP